MNRRPSDGFPSPTLRAFGLVALLLVWTAGAPAQTLAHVHLIATGGTISNRDEGRLTAEELAGRTDPYRSVAALLHLCGVRGGG